MKIEFKNKDYVIVYKDDKIIKIFCNICNTVSEILINDYKDFICKSCISIPSKR